MVVSTQVVLIAWALVPALESISTATIIAFALSPLQLTLDSTWGT